MVATEGSTQVPAHITVNEMEVDKAILTAIFAAGAAYCGQETDEGVALSITIDGDPRTAYIEELSVSPLDGVYKVVLQIPYADGSETWRFIMERLSEDDKWSIRQMRYARSGAAHQHPQQCGLFDASKPLVFYPKIR